MIGEIIRKVLSFLLDSIQTLLLAASVFLVVYIFIARPYQVSGFSMFPNFHDKDYVLTNLIVLKMEPIKIGDVVVFKAPPDPEKDYIKRVIGLPGDTVMVQNGGVYVNGHRLDENAYLAPTVQTAPGDFMHEGETVTVPPDNFIVMGDNRPDSSDSRSWGLVPRQNIIGKSLLIYFPPPDMRWVKNPFTTK